MVNDTCTCNVDTAELRKASDGQTASSRKTRAGSGSIVLHPLITTNPPTPDTLTDRHTQARRPTLYSLSLPCFLFSPTPQPATLPSGIT